VVDWEGWLRIDEAERRAGAVRGRERTKLVDRAAMRAHATPTPIPLEESTR
jgi:ferredoxin--NADP+ reductase